MASKYRVRVRYEEMPMKKGDFVATALWLIVCAGFLLYGAGLALLG
jgi:hypothetical protein